MTKIAITAGVCFVIMTAAASAGDLSYESRGYGGPLYVGPNFQQGGQHSPPVYGPKSSSERTAPVRRERVTKTRKAPKTQDAETEKSTPAVKSTAESQSAPSEKKAPAQSENSTISTAALPSDSKPSDAGVKATAAAPTTCKRFIAEVGKTVDVPCD
jgi:hypothetical protein